MMEFRRENVIGIRDYAQVGLEEIRKDLEAWRKDAAKTSRELKRIRIEVKAGLDHLDRA